MRADKIMIRKGDWVKVRSLSNNLRMQGLVYNINKTHISIKPARDYIRTEFGRNTIEVLHIIHRTAIANWWNFL